MQSSCSPKRSTTIDAKNGDMKLEQTTDCGANVKDSQQGCVLIKLEECQKSYFSVLTGSVSSAGQDSSHICRGSLIAIPDDSCIIPSDVCIEARQLFSASIDIGGENLNQSIGNDVARARRAPCRKLPRQTPRWQRSNPCETYCSEGRFQPEELSDSTCDSIEVNKRRILMRKNRQAVKKRKAKGQHDILDGESSRKSIWDSLQIE